MSSPKMSGAHCWQKPAMSASCRERVAGSWLLPAGELAYSRLKALARMVRAWRVMACAPPPIPSYGFQFCPQTWA